MNYQPITNVLNNKRVLVTGITGQVGRSLVNVLSGHCELVTAARSGADIELNLADSQQIVAVMASVKPDVVINAAAYTQVDQAEDEPEIAHSINALAPGVIAEHCKKYGSLLIHYSTDYVFSGSGSQPLTESNPVAPLNVYGKSKLDGERFIQAINCDHLIFRTCWVYDAAGKNFLNTILNLAYNKQVLQVVSDQFGTPTSAAFIAEVTYRIMEQCYTKRAIHKEDVNRIYNLTSAGFTTWFGFAEYIVHKARRYIDVMVEEITPVTTDQYPTKARRPSWSVLSTEKLINDFDLSLPSWEESVDECLDHKYVIGFNK